MSEVHYREIRDPFKDSATHECHTIEIDVMVPDGNYTANELEEKIEGFFKATFANKDTRLVKMD